MGIRNQGIRSRNPPPPPRGRGVGGWARARYYINSRTAPSSPENARALEVVPNARYGAEDVDKGLVALALASGRAEVACRVLAKEGMNVTAKTLRNWRDNLYTDRYWELHRKVLPRLQARAAEGHAAIADAAVELNAKLLERLDKDADELPIRDVGRRREERCDC